MSQKTQGTMLYFVDPLAAGGMHDIVTKVGCATSVTGISASRDQLDDTCLDSDARTFKPGLLAPGKAQFDINFDNADPSHGRLHALYKAGTVLQWALGWSDGTDAPTADSDGTLDLPTTRSWLTWEGYITDLPFDFGLNKLVTSQIGVQVSGFPDLFSKT